uniref:Uncharacterized protein n=1 Tax=Plectus sambesii TaxID=2011161 RepID=A0A914VTQ1_9BILA
MEQCAGGTGWAGGATVCSPRQTRSSTLSGRRRRKRPQKRIVAPLVPLADLPAPHRRQPPVCPRCGRLADGRVASCCKQLAHSDCRTGPPPLLARPPAPIWSGENRPFSSPGPASPKPPLHMEGLRSRTQLQANIL